MPDSVTSCLALPLPDESVLKPAQDLLGRGAKTRLAALDNHLVCVKTSRWSGLIWPERDLGVDSGLKDCRVSAEQAGKIVSRGRQCPFHTDRSRATTAELTHPPLLFEDSEHRLHQRFSSGIATSELPARAFVRPQLLQSRGASLLPTAHRRQPYRRRPTLSPSVYPARIPRIPCALHFPRSDPSNSIRNLASTACRRCPHSRSTASVIVVREPLSVIAWWTLCATIRWSSETATSAHIAQNQKPPRLCK